jgi:glycosyltransferase involved in cell wall biosynthesis
MTFVKDAHRGVCNSAQPMMISVVIPTHNSAAQLPRTLAALVQGAADGLIKQVIVVDAASTDDTVAMAEAAGCEVVRSEPGRARQMRAGAQAARANWMLFLHPGTALSAGWSEEVERFTRGPQARTRAAAFRLAFEDDTGARRAAFWARLRARVMKLPYGEQGLLISRLLYDALGGYPDLPAMEDVELARRIGRKRLHLLRTEAVSAAGKRAWRDLGLTTRYLMGADPVELAKAYE